MGWWRISGPEGGIDLSKKTACYNGDEPTDILGNALDEVDKAYYREWKRPARIAELEAAFAFVMGPLRREAEEGAR